MPGYPGLVMPDIERVGALMVLVVLALDVDVDVDVDVVLDPVRLGLMASFRFEVARRWWSQMITVLGAAGSWRCCCWTPTPLFDSFVLVLGADPIVVDSAFCVFHTDISVSLSQALHARGYRGTGEQHSEAIKHRQRHGHD